MLMETPFKIIDFDIESYILKKIILNYKNMEIKKEKFKKNELNETLKFIYQF